MAKSKKKIYRKKLREGDEVFLIGEEKYLPMILSKIYFEGKIEYGHCTWITSKLVNDELVHTNHEGTFLLSNLTLEPPAIPTEIFKF